VTRIILDSRIKCSSLRTGRDTIYTIGTLRVSPRQLCRLQKKYRRLMADIPCTSS
jgi:hypothetical protein